MVCVCVYMCLRVYVCVCVCVCVSDHGATYEHHDDGRVTSGEGREFRGRGLHFLRIGRIPQIRISQPEREKENARAISRTLVPFTDDLSRTTGWDHGMGSRNGLGNETTGGAGLYRSSSLALLLCKGGVFSTHN